MRKEQRGRRTNAHKWRRLALLALMSTAIALAPAILAVRTARTELDALKPHRWVVPRPIADGSALPGLRSVETTFGNGRRLRGWLVPSKNGAAIVMVHGSQADRRQLAPEATILASAGYGSLLFDLPGNGESEGEPWQGDERAAIVAAIDLLAAQPETDRGRLGVLGFSIGAAVVLMASPDLRLRAFVLEGCFTDAEQHKRDDYRRWGPFTQLPALWIDRAFAPGLASLRPIDSIGSIAPRPLLLVAGDADTIVPLEHARKLYAAALEPKELWIVRGAHHGDYATVAGDEYGARLIGFFDRSLQRSGP